MAIARALGVLGVGVDLVEVDRVEEVLKRHPERFARKVFTEAEAAYCRRSVRAAERFAARYAAKEAVMKALGTGWGRGVNFRDIEVVRAPSGRPSIQLSGAARGLARQLGVDRIDLSLTHGRDLAVAVVVFSGVRG